MISPTIPAWFNVFDAACAGVAAGAAVYVAIRDARWRKSGLAKQLEDRIAAAQETADGWDRSPPAVKLRGDVDRHSRKLGEHDDALKHLATKADMAALRGEITAVAANVEHAKLGVDRIEGFLIKQALGERAGG